ncbi:hypothetical protein LWI29_030328 [Acer saccharum]|uniref:Retrotransposon gag domain-containing protein n=1 Tax=Acer saccharum TaxID=4024 RepID=A0AA39TFB9_ACESA|nr:hypothetical protein LWI29_030328 [Acer saccharum]
MTQTVRAEADPSRNAARTKLDCQSVAREHLQDPCVTPVDPKTGLQKWRPSYKRFQESQPPFKKSTTNSFADSPFIDAIALVKIPKKFSFPNMKQFEGTTSLDDHIAQYKQRMFTATIPHNLIEACMCKAFGSSLNGPALPWYTNLPNNSITFFAQLTDTFVEQFESSQKFKKQSDDLYTIT